MDINKLAHRIVQQATADDDLTADERDAQKAGKNLDAFRLGKLGGSKGGKKRAANLTKEQRAEIAKKAAAARWAKAKDTKEA